MSTLQLKLRRGAPLPFVEFHVDGEDLGARVKRAFGENVADDVLPWRGTDYKMAETVLGEDVRRSGARGVLLFACGCGSSSCGSIFADVKVTDDTIMFSNFSPLRGAARPAEPLQPVVFDRRQFEEAVQQLERDVEAWQPPAK